MTELAYAGQVTIRKRTSPSPPSRKRRKTMSSDMSFPPALNTSHIVTDRTIGSRDTSPLNAMSTVSTPVSATPPNFSLPMNSNELGRLPVYGQFKFTDSTVAGPHQETLSEKDRGGMIPSGSGTPAPTGFFSFQQSLWQSSLPSSPAGTSNLSSTIASTEPVTQRAVDESPASFLSLETMPGGPLSENVNSSRMDGSSTLSSVDNTLIGVSGLNTEDPLATNGMRSGGDSVIEPSSLLDSDAMTMWSTTPTGFE